MELMNEITIKITSLGQVYVTDDADDETALSEEHIATLASGVAVIRFKHDAWPGVANLMEVAREICQEYTSWCNGDIYGIITFHRRPALDAPNCPVLVPDEFATEQWVEGDDCWGFVGHEYAERTAKNNDL